MNPQYRYFIGLVEVFPKNSGIQNFTFKRVSESSVVFDLELDDDFVFDSSAGTFDFKAQEASNLCEELEFTIEQKCGSTWAVLWEGVFAVSEGSFDNYNCIFKIKPKKKLYLLEDIEVNILDYPERIEGSSSDGVVTDPSGGANRRGYINCIYLKDVLLFVAQRSNPSIVSVISDFFQINPLNAFPFSFTNYWNYLAVGALSDIQEPIPSNPATTERITFKKLMADLYALFCVQWIIDDNYNLRIEHETFFEGSSGLDVTTSNFARYVKGTDKTQYDIKGFIKEEIWRIVDHQEQVTVVYGGLANLNKEKNSQVYETTKIRTDYELIRTGNNNSTAEGLVLFATDGGIASGGVDIVVHDTTSLLLTSSVLNLNYANSALSPTVLVQAFHTFNRSSPNGIYTAVNRLDRASSHSGGIVLDSIKPALLQDEFSVPLCCTAFDPQDQVVTALGNGYVQEAKYEGKSGMLKLKLKYKIDNCDFEPSDLSGLDVWLKYNEGITQTGGPGLGGFLGEVTQWNDASGNGRHAVQAGASSLRPKWYTSGSYNGVLFTDAGGTKTPFLTIPAFGLFPSKRGTIFILTHTQGAVAGNFSSIAVLSTNDGGAGNFFDIFLSAPENFFRSSNYGSALYPHNGVYLDPPFNTSRNNSGLYVIKREADTSFYCRQDSLECVDNPFGAVPNNVPTVKPLIIGHNSNVISTSGAFMLVELIIYGRALNAREIENVELYLAKKNIYKIVGS